MKPSPLYTLVTNHWPKVASGLVASVGALELILNNDDNHIEWYLLAWGSITGGIWFLFDIAEKSAPIETRARLSELIRQDRKGEILKSIPDRFGNMFDQLFGKKHLSFLCFRRSVMASIISAWIVSTLVYSINPGVFGQGFVSSIAEPRINESLINVGMLGVLAVFVNILPDYLSLLQTRYMLKWIKGGAQSFVVLIVDALATASIFVAIVLLGSILVEILAFTLFIADLEVLNDTALWRMIVRTAEESLLSMFFLKENDSMFGILLLTTFFTSAWLWIYIAAIWLSRILVKLNSGIGFLLRIVDVDRQPMRSVGFVSVILVSCLFILGLPFVIW